MSPSTALQAISIVIHYWLREENRLRRRQFLEAHMERRARVFQFSELRHLRMAVLMAGGDISSIDRQYDEMCFLLQGYAIGICAMCGDHLEYC